MGRASSPLLTPHRIPTSDLLIASTALLRGDEVVTGNARHFHRVPGLFIE
jgi:predicted nucleic acid-binding protein